MRGLRILLALGLGGLLVLSACNLQTLVGPDDKAIIAEIQSKLFQDSVLKTRNITVNCQKGVVVLNGTVGSDAEKASAEDIANKASGVKQVVDQLTVSTATPQAAPPTQTASTETNEPPVPAPTAAAPAVAKRRRHESSAARSKASTSGESGGGAASAASPATTPTTTAETTPTPTTPPPPPKPEPVTVPAGAVITVQMIDPIDSAKNKPGEEFSATLFSPIVVGDKVVAPRGANARVRLVQSASAGHMQGRSELDVQLISVEINGQAYSVDSNTYKKVGASRGTNTAEKVGGGAVVGALIGGLIGHGKGAAIGAGVGAGSGAAVQEATKGQQVQISSESKIDFTLKSPITVSY
jgi:BON domain-containing protein